MHHRSQDTSRFVFKPEILEKLTDRTVCSSGSKDNFREKKTTFGEGLLKYFQKNSRKMFAHF